MFWSYHQLFVSCTVSKSPIGRAPYVVNSCISLETMLPTVELLELIVSYSNGMAGSGHGKHRLWLLLRKKQQQIIAGS